ncbi:hypothetical protein MAM1_0059c03740 [Mucor ambiguus]|uniref:Uncharacterized protein n=1 Tax=Mucor ambiguus TaxID=91626 RepID=A0A0C9LU24_9FUNG|nr:hypothetical protein MAM1_0059c03740 [Mucor ambiguus]
MSDKSDIEDADNMLNYPVSDINQTKENDDIQQQQEDDFGSFDDATEEDDFGDFEEEEELEIDSTPIFNTFQEAMDLWQHLLDQIYHYEALDSFTGNAPKSIKQYVLEEAPESLHSRLTWDSVTRYMENDTGTPKVKWHQSEIERHYLNALACKRAATVIIANTPTMLDTYITQEPQLMMGIKPALNTVIGSNVSAAATTAADLVVDQPASPNSSTTTPTTSEKRSSVFGLSSLSRFLPHLSKSNLPKSPTTTTAPTSPITASKSLPRQQSVTINHLNVSTLKQESSLKRSNSVAFTSRREHTTAPSPSIQAHTAKPRPTSFQSAPVPPPQSMDLFDLTEDPATIIKSPTKLQFNFEPLVPTHALSPTPVRRNTIPANMHSDTKPVTHGNPSLDTIQDDEFGDFTAEVKQDLGLTREEEEEEDEFGDFSKERPVPSKPADFTDEDPFGIMGSSSTMISNKQSSLPLDKGNDPYGIASYTQHPPQPPPAQQSNHLASLEHSSFTPQSPAVALPKTMPCTTFDLVTPLASGPVHQSDTIVGTDVWNASGQESKTDVKSADDDDDEWGDWAF